jgi:hypothetical protein
MTHMGWFSPQENEEQGFLSYKNDKSACILPSDVEGMFTLDRLSCFYMRIVIPKNRHICLDSSPQYPRGHTEGLHLFFADLLSHF